MRKRDKVENRLAVVVLAAGGSTRLGQPKQLVEIDAVPLIKRQCQLALSVSDDVFCVVGCMAAQMQDVLVDMPITIIENNLWQQGMGSSIAFAVDHLNEQFSAVMLLLVDQWLLTTDDLKALKSAYLTAPNNIWQSEYSNDIDRNMMSKRPVYGPPVIFPQYFFSELTELTGEQGAKGLITKNQSITQSLLMTNACYDLDTPEDLEAVNVLR